MKTLIPMMMLAMFAQPASAQSCSGNGCGSIVVEQPARCIVLRNLSDRPIRVTPNAPFVSIETVYGRSARSPMFEGACLTDYSYDYTAEIVGGVSGATGCKKVRNMRELGYGTGHKTRFCKRKGYQSVFNIPGARYHANGGGWCFSGDREQCRAAIGR